ncbi:retrovirus-related pol polyprotein from transposon TNT 1-94 [Tanacetum coccineum]
MPKSSLQLVDEFVDEGVPEKEPTFDDEEANLLRALELSLKELEKQGLACPVVIREPDSGRLQPLPERCTPMTTEPAGSAGSPSLDAELPLTDSEMEFDEEVPGINAGDQDEDQDGPNSSEQDEGQARPNHGVQDEGQENLKLPTKDQVILEEPASSTKTLSSLQNLDKELSFTNQFFIEKPQEEEPEKTNTKSELTGQCKPLRAHFSNLPAVDMKEIIQQRIFEDKSYEAHEDYKNLSGRSSLKKRKKHAAPRSPSGSPPLQPPPPPPPAGASGALAGVSGSQELSPANSLMHDDSIPYKKWKPLPAEERPATPELAWTIPFSSMSDVQNNWASALYYRQVNKTELTEANFKGQAYEVVKAFYPDVIHLQFQMEECHKMLTDQVDWTNPQRDQVRIDVNRPLPLGGPPGHVTIQTQFFFNKDLEYLRYGSKRSNPTLLISKIKAARYPDFGLELLVPEQMWIDDKFYIDKHDSSSRRKEVRTHMRILGVIKIKAYSTYGYDYLSEIVLQTVDFKEHTIAEKDFKNLYPSDFEDLNLLLLQGHLDHLPSSNKQMLSTVVKLWTRNLVIRQRVKDFQLGIKSYQT